jgi:hypothetical protein
MTLEGRGTPAMEHPELAAAAGASGAIARLRQSVVGWMDADRVLPADGSSLMVALELALEGLTGENPSSARAGMVAFIRRVEVLIDAGAIKAVEGRLPLETVDALLAMLGE